MHISAAEDYKYVIFRLFFGQKFFFGQKTETNVIQVGLVKAGSLE